VKIEVFKGCCGGNDVTNLVKRIVSEQGIAAEIIEINDMKESLSRGIMSTPAIAVNGIVVAAGRTPSYDTIVKYLNKKG